MKTLNPNTKKAKAFKLAYLTNSYQELYQIYGSISTNKEIAMIQYKRMCYDEKGYDLRIISWNTFQIICAWRVENNLRVETRDNSYIIPNAF